MAKTYREKLMDPRWQRKRLEIMERDGFACCRCGAGDKTLNVHHGFYDRGCAPWEYNNRFLWTLCEECHKIVGDRLTTVHAVIGAIDPTDGHFEWALDVLLKALAGVPEVADFFSEVRDNRGR